jgi:uncharacterized protein (TIGR03000 family)
VGVLLTTAAGGRAQFSTRYYGSGDYRRFYGYGRDFFPDWNRSFGYGAYWGPRSYPMYLPRNALRLYAPAADDDMANLPGPREPTPSIPVTIEVQLPAEAELWIEGRKMSLTGGLRKFISPPLLAGQRFTYEFRARWKEEGREVMRTQNLEVAAGEQHRINFLASPLGPGRIEDFPERKAPMPGIAR